MRDFRLVRGVSRIPAGIFENVSLDDRRRNAAVVAGADERTDDFVFVCNGPQLRERFGFRFRLRQVQLPIKPDIFRNSSVDQRIKILKTHLAQHCANFLFVRADVAAHE